MERRGALMLLVATLAGVHGQPRGPFIRVIAEVRGVDLAALNTAARAALGRAYAGAILSSHRSPDCSAWDLQGRPDQVTLELGATPATVTASCLVYGLSPARNAVGLFGQGFRQLLADRTEETLGASNVALTRPLSARLANVALGGTGLNLEDGPQHLVSFMDRCTELIWGDSSGPSPWAWVALAALAGVSVAVLAFLVAAKSCPDRCHVPARRRRRAPPGAALLPSEEPGKA